MAITVSLDHAGHLASRRQFAHDLKVMPDGCQVNAGDGVAARPQAGGNRRRDRVVLSRRLIIRNVDPQRRRRRVTHRIVVLHGDRERLKVRQRVIVQVDGRGKDMDDVEDDMEDLVEEVAELVPNAS